MSIPTCDSPAASSRRRFNVRYIEQPFPLHNAAHAVHSSSPVARATRATPRRLPTPDETSHIIGGRPLQLDIYEPHHDSARSVRPHSCDSLECAMEKSMNNIEILEHIFTFLPTREVLSLQLVSKKWRSLVTDSPQLFRHFFVEPRWSFPPTKFQLLHLAVPGLEIKRGNPVHLGQWVEVRMNLAAAKEISATLEKITATAGNIPGTLNGAFLRLSRPFNDDFQTRRPAVRFVPPIPLLQPNHADLFITQPPLKGMQAFLVDAHGASLEAANPEDTVEPAHAKMSCDAGITLGFLAEVAEWMFEKRKRSLQGEDHQNKVAVFKAIVSFCVQSDAAPRMRSATRTVTEIESLQ